MSKKKIRRRISLMENIKVALRAIRANKLRAGLTSLGIIIGVATVIAMMTIVGGINHIVASEFNRMGANVFSLSKFPAIHITFDWSKFRRRQDLTIEDAEMIGRSCPSVDMVSPFIYYWKGETVRGEGRKTDPNVAVIATNEMNLMINGMEIELGRNFSGPEDKSGARVCVLGYDVVEKLFPWGSPVDRHVRVGSDRYRVIGVTERLGSIFGESRDNYVAIPLGAYLRKWKIEDDLNIDVKVRRGIPTKTAIEEVRALMRIRHKLKLTEPDDFEITTRDSLMTSYASMTGSIFIAAIGIAMISLLVGGVGIMNILLVSVRERTREIGIRKALGARRRDISRQFLIESITLSGLGGLIGVLLAVGGLLLVRKFTDALPMSFSPDSFILALVFSCAVGIFFGVYPARKAAALDPIESLRYE